MAAECKFTLDARLPGTNFILVIPFPTNSERMMQSSNEQRTYFKENSEKADRQSTIPKAEKELLISIWTLSDYRNLLLDADVDLAHGLTKDFIERELAQDLKRIIISLQDYAGMYRTAVQDVQIHVERALKHSYDAFSASNVNHRVNALRACSEELDKAYRQSDPLIEELTELTRWVQEQPQITTLIEIVLGLNIDQLTIELLNSLRRELSAALGVFGDHIVFLGYRPGSIQLLTAITGIITEIPSDIQTRLPDLPIEKVTTWEQLPERLTFISYTEPDKKIAHAIYEYLLTKQLNPWLADENILAGERKAAALMKAVNMSTGFVLCFSNNSINQQRFHEWEVTQAIQKAEDRFRDGIYLIPVRIDNCDIPDQIAEYKVLDWKQGENLDKLERSVREGLRRLH